MSIAAIVAIIVAAVVLVSLVVAFGPAVRRRHPTRGGSGPNKSARTPTAGNCGPSGSKPSPTSGQRALTSFEPRPIRRRPSPDGKQPNLRPRPTRAGLLPIGSEGRSSSATRRRVPSILTPTRNVGGNLRNPDS